MIPKNKNIAFKFNNENEFNDLTKILLKIFKNDISLNEYEFYDEKYIFYDNNNIEEPNNKVFNFYEIPMKSSNFEQDYLIIQGIDLINIFRKQKLTKILNV